MPYKKKKKIIIGDNLSLSGSSHEFSHHADPVIEEPDDPVVRQRGQPDDTAVRERGQRRIPARSSQPGHQKTSDRSVHRRRRRWRRNNNFTHNNFTHDVRDGVLRRLRLRRIRRESVANRSGSARRSAGPKSGMIQRIRRRFEWTRILSTLARSFANSFPCLLCTIFCYNICY